MACVDYEEYFFIILLLLIYFLTGCVLCLAPNFAFLNKNKIQISIYIILLKSSLLKLWKFADIPIILELRHILWNVTKCLISWYFSNTFDIPRFQYRKFHQLIKMKWEFLYWSLSPIDAKLLSAHFICCFHTREAWLTIF